MKYKGFIIGEDLLDICIARGCSTPKRKEVIVKLLVKGLKRDLTPWEIMEEIDYMLKE